MLLAAVKMAFLAVTPAGFSYGLVGGEIENATAVPTIEQKEFSNLQKKKRQFKYKTVYWDDSRKSKKRLFSTGSTLCV